MSATLERRNARRWLAWCDEHQDGYQGGKPTATKWAEKHNAEHHAEAAA